MKALATVLKGSASEKQFVLDPNQPIRIGRGSGCQVVLSDPLSSRTHAIISYEDGVWILADADSSNGTLVNGKKINRHKLSHGDMFQLGSTELLFEIPDEDADTALGHQTLVRETPISLETSGVHSLSQLVGQQRVQDSIDLYQLSIRLMRCHSPDDVARTGLEILRIRTKSTVVGFLWIDEQGDLKPQLISPANRGKKLRLHRKLTERVSLEGKGIWVKEQWAEKGSEPGFADAICIPLIAGNGVIGAIHLYREEGNFHANDFDFVISVGNLLSAALENSRAQASLSAEHQRLVERSADVQDLLGHSSEMQRLKDRIARVARANGCVLIRGESGVGKELVSRALHRMSPRKDRPLLCINCAAIPGELMESQLFGHKKGSFTGADRDHAGIFQQAHTGTLFLDEVGELTLEGQAKLLRILEGHPFSPVGETKQISVDVRIIAATNRDLREYVREKQFREDLYYRLSVFELVVPPLRERGNDIELLLNYFFEHFKAQHGRKNLVLSDQSRSLLLGYSWPGNVRQLRNVVDSAVVLASTDVVQPIDLSLHDLSEERMDCLKLDFWEERLIREALQRTENNINEATQLLGVSRATLYRKLEQYSIKR
jgi:transcriptional regulator with GAF, ATPase, and Fis domain/pSer/pThr/pTyr-binding forkhead associated (FHA) protein